MSPRRTSGEHLQYILHWDVLGEVRKLPEMNLTSCTVALGSDLTLETTSRILEPVLGLVESKMSGILRSLLVDQGEVPDTKIVHVQLQEDEIYPMVPVSLGLDQY